MTSGGYIFKTRPAYFFLSFMLATGAFCLWAAYKLWNLMPGESNGGTSGTTMVVIKVIFVGFVFLFGLTALWSIATSKICYLTETELIIKRPLVFYKLVIARADIRNISEKDSNIDVDNTGFSRSLIKIGNTSILLLKDGKKVQISSIDVGGYRELMKKLSHRV